MFPFLLCSLFRIFWFYFFFSARSLIHSFLLRLSLSICITYGVGSWKTSHKGGAVDKITELILAWVYIWDRNS